MMKQNRTYAVNDHSNGAMCFMFYFHWSVGVGGCTFRVCQMMVEHDVWCIWLYHFPWTWLLLYLCCGHDMVICS